MTVNNRIVMIMMLEL